VKTGGDPNGVPPAQDASAHAKAAANDHLKTLCTAMGIPAPEHLGPDGWASMGKSIRSIVDALADLTAARAAVKHELRAEELTKLHSRDNNPLKAGMSSEDLLQYLLFNGTGAGGFLPAVDAIKASVNELRSHDLATIAATRAAVEGVIAEFHPEKLKAKLGKGKTRLPQFLDRGRLWESYEEYYGKRSEHMADWLEQVFNRHFMPTYSKETSRLNRGSRLQGLAPTRDP
jgi:FHA domain-containing protein